MQIEKLTQLHGAAVLQQQSSTSAKQPTANKLRAQTLDAYETELTKDSNRSGSSTGSEAKWQIHEKNNQIMRLVLREAIKSKKCDSKFYFCFWYRLESEQRQLEEQVMRQTANLDKSNQVSDRWWYV